MEPQLVIYAGTFDPPTLGHLDLIERARIHFRHLVVAVAQETGKQTLFSAEERVTLLRRLTSAMDNVEVDVFPGLLVDYARQRKIPLVLRGMRPGADFDYEFQMALTNRQLAPEIDTMFFMTSADYMFISSSLVKQIAALGGDISNMVPPLIAKALRAKMAE